MAETAKQIETEQHVPGGEHGGGFPPFQSDTFASQLLWLALTFGALYLLMSRLALPRIGSILEDRKGRIDGDLRQAELLKEQSEAAIAAYEKALADARGRAQAVANETRDREAAKAAEVRKELDAALNARVAKAEEIVATSRTTAMANVQDIAIDAAVAIVERLIGVAPASETVKSAVGDALKG